MTYPFAALEVLKNPGVLEVDLRFDGLAMPPDLARKFLLLKLSLTAPAPKAPKSRAIK